MSIRRILCSSVLLVSLTAVGGYAQDHGNDHQDNQHYVRHNEWRKGTKIKKEDWSRGASVDYRTHHLRTPPRGYEWREVDGNYVLAAVATGLIASAIVASTAH
jgi:Ni/Co efflux regulator RcnB